MKLNHKLATALLKVVSAHRLDRPPIKSLGITQEGFCATDTHTLVWRGNITDGETVQVTSGFTDAAKVASVLKSDVDTDALPREPDMRYLTISAVIPHGEHSTNFAFFDVAKIRALCDIADALGPKGCARIGLSIDTTEYGHCKPMRVILTKSSQIPGEKAPGSRNTPMIRVQDTLSAVVMPMQVPDYDCEFGGVVPKMPVPAAE